jgi:hypothetical protein
VYLPRTKNENDMVRYIVPDEVYLMDAFAFFQGKNKKEVMFMKRVNQVISSEQIAHLADAEPTGMAGLYGRSGNLSNGYFLHLSNGLHESGKVALI